MYLTPPLREFPLEFCNCGSAQNSRLIPLPDHQKSLDDMSVHLDIIPALEAQTDGLMERSAIKMVQMFLGCMKLK